MQGSWFNNTTWFPPRSGMDMGAMHQIFRSSYGTQSESEADVQQCSDSSQCASGFICSGGKCIKDTQSETWNSCGGGITGDSSGGSGGGSVGCGGDATSSSGASIGSCNTASAGDCSSSRGTEGGDNTGGGGGCCGTSCCQCDTSGCYCHCGECPPPPPSCSRFCTEAIGLGSNVKSCGPKACGICEYCDELKGSTCQPKTETYDCRCGYKCPGCNECSVGGNCLISPCDNEKVDEKPERDPEDKCEPICTTSEVCVTNTTTGTVTCGLVQQCADLAEDCEECDCQCGDDCGSCEFCNSNGKCERDPDCDKPLRWTCSGTGNNVSVSTDPALYGTGPIGCSWTETTGVCENGCFVHGSYSEISVGPISRESAYQSAKGSISDCVGSLSACTLVIYNDQGQVYDICSDSQEIFCPDTPSEEGHSSSCYAQVQCEAEVDE